MFLVQTISPTVSLRSPDHQSGLRKVDWTIVWSEKRRPDQ